jgi:hypothetical protein
MFYMLSTRSSHAMERTSHARSRPPSLILLSLDHAHHHCTNEHAAT